jgi:hypothetical protein
MIKKIVLALLIGFAGAQYAVAETKKELEEQLAEARRKVEASIDKSLSDFMAGPPGNCNSQHLLNVIIMAKYVAGELDDLESRQLAAGWLLDVGDAAAEHGCPEEARMTYQFVIKVFIGEGYAAHRQRAQIGLDDLRAQR